MRFGSAELYDVIDMCFAPDATHHAHAIADCLAVGQNIASGTDERVIMFVKLLEGEALSDDLVKRIKHEIRMRRSARHVPCEVSVQCRGDGAHEEALWRDSLVIDSWSLVLFDPLVRWSVRTRPKTRSSASPLPGTLLIGLLL